MNFIKLREME